MELHQLRYFLAVARTKNFSRGAEQCHVAQPSLSQQIMKLEDELGEQRVDLVLDDGQGDRVFPDIARHRGVELWSNT